jgi:hypothetical protein
MSKARGRFFEKKLRKKLLLILASGEFSGTDEVKSFLPRFFSKKRVLT